MHNEISDSELLDYDAGRLTAGRIDEIDRALMASEDLRRRLQFVVGTRSLMQSAVSRAAESGDTPFMTDNIMRAVMHESAQKSRMAMNDFVAWISFVFRPVVGTALVLIVMLAAYNYASSDNHVEELSTTEAVLGLPPVSIASAYEVTY